MTDRELIVFAETAGLSAQWVDYRGESRQVTPEVLRAVLKSLGMPADTAADVQGSRARLDAMAESPLLTADAGARLVLPTVATAEVELLHEDSGQRLVAAVMPGDRPSIVAPVAPGYYQVDCGGTRRRVAVAPSSCLPPALKDARRWGLSAQLYALRGRNDPGFGDFTALSALARWAGARGADALAISPVHALYSADARRFSPYSPSSRLFLNVLYADPGTVLDQLPARSTDNLQDLVDWPAAAARRLAALRAAYAQLGPALEGSGEIASQFSAFVADGGQHLLEHARFEALSAESCARGGYCSWREWPQDLRDPQSAAVAAFAHERADEVRFHLFAQWLAARGLAAAQQSARDAGMAIGLIGDLAVGTDAGGSHAWSLQDAMLNGLSVGAPPDLLAGQGQNWGLTTFSPHALHRQGFTPFIELLRANLKHVGGVRIDHILGLKRLWLAPERGSAADGVYLRYPIEQMLRLIRLEAWRHGALIIGEDLGTVPEGLREQLEEGGILGMRVLLFERDHRLFVEPQRWSAKAMATTTTHDLPTIAGWWQGRDLDWRASAAQFGESSSETVERASRAEDRVLLWAALAHQGLVAGATPQAEATPALNDAAIQFVARTPAPLALIPIDDVLGVVEQPNVPGTTDQHPNWQRRLPVAIEALETDSAALARTAQLGQERPRP